MKTFARTKDRNDLYLDSTGQIAMCEGYDFYAQEIEAAILTVQGEIQLDVTLGIPYFTTIFDSRCYKCFSRLQPHHHYRWSRQDQ